MKLGSSIRRRRGEKKEGSSWKWVRSIGGALSRWQVLRNPLFYLAFGVVAALGLGGGYFYSTRVLFPPPPPPGDLAPVPDLRGASPEEAGDRLESAGLVLGRLDSLGHPFVPRGVILGQSPLPGQLALVGDTVRAAVSTGPERRAVPDVLRLRADRAYTVLEATGFSVRMDSVDSEMPQGGVVSMDPEPGTEVAVPGDVFLRVSKGPPLVEVPLLIGLEEEHAVALLDSLGLVVSEIETRFRFGRDQGLVVEQEPSALSQVMKGTAVRLVVGRRGFAPGQGLW
jgi:beta-lactam-binding protein with PASTA domain